MFAECDNGIFDGFRVDTAGRMWASAADGVHCLETDGTLIGKIRVPETVSNVCFGGSHRNRLFITATTSLYSVYLLLRGGADNPSHVTRKWRYRSAEVISSE